MVEAGQTDDRYKKIIGGKYEAKRLQQKVVFEQEDHHHPEW